jgi:hypothetical protein
MLSLIAQQGSSAPAGGAAAGEALAATAGAVVITALMLGVVIGHRTGRLPQVKRLSDFAERSSGIPGWSSLPLAWVAGSLFVAVLGMYWDIAIHIDEGRDPGPLANAAHYFILLGLFGIFFAGLLSMALPKAGRPSAASIKLVGDWYAPLGGVLMTASSSFALAAFPMDDVWHRIFGQDVTLWGPTHLVLIGGAGLATVGGLILLAEGVRSRGESMPRRHPRWLLFRQAAIAGAFLTALSTFQAEFDFSVPQFRLVWHPILLMLAAGIGLVTARVMIGRGGALFAVGIFVVIRGLLALWVDPLTGHTPVHFPLYIVEALVVEAVALRMDAERPIPFGAVAGLGIGTLGLAAEWGWSHIWWTIPWTGALVPEGIIVGVLAGVAGGVIGGFVGGSLREPAAERRPEMRWGPALAAAVAIGLFAWALPMNAGDTVRAQVTLRDVNPPPERTVAADVKLDPPDAAEDAEWLNATAWQGGGSVVDALREVGPGEYRTTRPIPVYDNWKVTLRLHKDRQVAGLPLFMPKDEAIPVGEIPARPSFTREFILDKENLLRELKKGVPPALSVIAYAIVLAIGLGLAGALAWGLGRFARVERRERAAR